MSGHHHHSSSGHYKELCGDLRHDLKRKRRELEDAEDRLRRCESDTKKAKIEAEEILKLYQGLQRELQLAYERNAKLQADKVSYEGLLDSERKEFEAYKKQQASSSDDSKKLKDALCAMRIEKLELETKLNSIVMENKELRDRARRYEPRLREMDELKRQLTQIEQMVNEELKGEIRTQNECAQRAQVKQEHIERYTKWNDLLQRECDEKGQQLKRYSELIVYCQQLEEEKSHLELEMSHLRNRAMAQASTSSTAKTDFASIIPQIGELRRMCQCLKDDFKREFSICMDGLMVAGDSMKTLVTDKAGDSCIEIGTSLAPRDDA